MNVLHLDNARLAVLSTLLFNALIIPLMVPIAIRGAPFRPRTAVDLLRTNILVYGVGGFVSAFVGIEVLYLLLQSLLANPSIAGFIDLIVRWMGS